MKPDKTKLLEERYYSGESSLEEEKDFLRTSEAPFESGLWKALGTLANEKSEFGPGQAVAQMERRARKFRPNWAWLAASVVIALTAGWLIGKGSSEGPSQLESELLSSQLGTRMQAVYQVAGQSELDSRLSQVIMDLLRNDEHINIRLSLIEAITPHIDKELLVELMQMLEQEENQLVQVALADLIGANAGLLKAEELKVMLETSKLSESIKKRISHGLEI